MLNNDEDDIENHIPAHNIVIGKNNTELKVIKQRIDTQGFLETNVELHALASEAPRTTIISKQPPLHKAICFRIEDVKSNCTHHAARDCWQFRNVLFKCVLLYGRVTVKSESTRNERSFYTINVDDETESIDGYLNKTPRDEVAKNKQDMNKMRIDLEWRKKTGIVQEGKFYGPDTDECKARIASLERLHEMILKNMKLAEKNFLLGVISENCLVYAIPFLNAKENVMQLRVLDLHRDESIELSWKQNLNNVYRDWYFKS